MSRGRVTDEDLEKMAERARRWLEDGDLTDQLKSALARDVLVLVDVVLRRRDAWRRGA